MWLLGYYLSDERKPTKNKKNRALKYCIRSCLSISFYCLFNSASSISFPFHSHLVWRVWMYCRYIYFKLVYCCAECGLFLFYFFFLFVLYVSVCDRIDALAQIPQTLRHRKIYSTKQNSEHEEWLKSDQKTLYKWYTENILTYTRGGELKKRENHERNEEKWKRRIWIISEFSNVSRCEYVSWRFWVSCFLVRYEFLLSRSSELEVIHWKYLIYLQHAYL